MTTQQLKDLARALAQFSADYHSDNPPYEISATLDLIDDTISEEQEEERRSAA